MDRQVYKCECGYVTHFVKALEAHCRFRHHQPEKEEETIMPEVTEEVKKAVKRVAKAKKSKAETQPEINEEKTRRPRAKKTAEKEQK